MYMKKKMLCLLLLLWGIFSVGNAQKLSPDVFGRQVDSICVLMNKALGQKDYRQGERFGKKLASLFNSQPQKTQNARSWLVPGIYYNLACCQSILHKKGSAIKSLQPAYKAGYQDYRHAMKDTDLDFLHGDKRF